MNKFITLSLVACTLISSSKTFCMLRAFSSSRQLITVQRRYVSQRTVFNKNHAPKHIEETIKLKTATEKKLDNILWLQRKLLQQEEVLLKLEALNDKNLESLKEAQDNDTNDFFSKFPMQINKLDVFLDRVVDLDDYMQYQRQDFKDLLAKQRPTNNKGHANE